MAYTFPASLINNGSGRASLLDQPTVTTLVDNGNGTFNCYFMDGQGAYASPTQTATTAATSAVADTIFSSTAAADTVAAIFLPGIELTQPQIAGMVCGFTSSASCPDHWGTAPVAWGSKGYTSLISQPAVNWTTHTFYSGDSWLRDCPFFQSYSNGGLTGTAPYYATWAMCHVTVTTNAPQIRFKTIPGGNPGLGPSMTARVDGVPG